MLKAFVLALMLALGLSVQTSTPVASPTPMYVTATKTAIEQQHSTTHRIGVYDLEKGNTWNQEVGHCSGTVVGPHAILTAQHCFFDSNLIRLDAEKDPIRIVSVLIDGSDHVIYIVDRTFKAWASINERALVPNEPVHIWGAPGHNTDVYRSGYFVGYSTLKEVDPDLKVQFERFILPTFGGDSGAGLFDENGSVVAVISMGDTSAENYDVPLAFTPDQLDAATR
jgi:V8-like Glu-specific endopeptidase